MKHKKDENNPGFEQEMFELLADITKLPEDITPLPDDINVEVSIGDLHGNALKLIWHLIQHGVLEMSQEQYAELVNIYRYLESGVIEQLNEEGIFVDKNELREKIDTFGKILNNAAVNNNARVILLGDDMSDRGALDFLVLQTFGVLKQNNVDTSILLSDHGFEFLESYEKFFRGKTKRFETRYLSEKMQTVSMTRMQTLIDHGVLHIEKDIIELTEEAYLPAVKAIDYSLDKNSDTIYLYSHAPCGLSAVQSLAQQLNVNYDDTSAENIAASIDRINEKITEKIKNNSLYEIAHIHEYFKASKNNALKDTLAINYPLAYLMFNRDYKNNIDRKATTDKGVNVVYVHGHDSEDPLKFQKHVVCLDSWFGKGKIDGLLHGKKERPCFSLAFKPESRQKRLKVRKKSDLRQHSVWKQPKKEEEKSKGVLSSLYDIIKPFF